MLLVVKSNKRANIIFLVLRSGGLLGSSEIVDAVVGSDMEMIDGRLDGKYREARRVRC